MGKYIRILLGLAIIGGAAGWVMTAPEEMPPSVVAELTGDASRGERVFHAAGCASCHAAKDASGEAKLILAGGTPFDTDFGTFYAPNISPDPDQGIGGWTLAEFAQAVKLGVSPEGKHYYPAFPYTAYRQMDLQDVADLKAFMDTLPADATPSKPHDVGFPFNIRRSLGGWKLLYSSPNWVLEDGLTEQQQHGRYLVEGLAHCGECHSPRDAFGGIIRAEWLSGAPNPSGKGTIPNITPGGLDWSEEDIAYYLESGFTPDFDSAGGSMASVVDNMSKLPPEDRAAIAAYLKAVPAVE